MKLNRNKSLGTIHMLVFLFIAAIGAPRSAYADEMQPLQNVIDTEALSAAGIENEELKLQRLELYRARMTQVLRNVRKTKILSEVDIDELNTQGEALANAAFEAFLIASAKTRAAADTGGERGDAAAITDMEIAMRSLEIEMGLVYSSANKITKDVRAGKTVLSGSLIDRMSDQELRDTLGDRGLQVHQEKNLLDPFRSERVKRLKPGSPLSFLDEFGQSTTGFNRSLSMALDFIIPSAHAVVAAPCIAPCSAKDWPICATCVVTAGDAAIQAYNSFVACWNSASGWSKWFKRTWCLTKFVTILA